ncbi:MAG: AzlC family ABC transporter permease [Betaproteobacteria bacterium]|jgi:predicted branched-subunit amino acid permease
MTDQTPTTYPNQSFKFALLKGMKAAFLGPAFVLAGGMIGFGAMAHAAGMDLSLTLGITIFLHALPGQIVFVEMMSMGIAASVIALAVCFTATRFLTMTLTLLPQIPQDRYMLSRFLSVHFLAMSSWTYCMRDFPKIEAELRYGYFVGMGLTCWLIALPSTAAGYLLTGHVPQWITYGLLFINPLFFLLSFTEVPIPANRVAIVFGGIVGVLIHLVLPTQSLLISGLGVGTLVWFIDFVIRRRRLKGQR